MDTTKQLTLDYLDYAINMQRTVKSTISQPSKDENGNVEKTTDSEGKKHTVYDWKVGVSYTLDYSNVILTDVMTQCDGALVIKVANKTRKQGETAARALDGTVLDVKELLTEQRRAKSPDEVALSLDDNEWDALVKREAERRGIKIK